MLMEAWVGFGTAGMILIASVFQFLTQRSKQRVTS